MKRVSYISLFLCVFYFLFGPVCFRASQPAVPVLWCLIQTVMQGSTRWLLNMNVRGTYVYVHLPVHVVFNVAADLDN